MELADWSVGVVPEVGDGPAFPTLHIPVKDSFDSAPGWRDLGTYYTCVPDAQYPWDPVVMKRIQEFAPDAVPLWVQWVFRSPGADSHVEVFGRHALGRVLDKGRTDTYPFRVHMPTMPVLGMTFQKPNNIWFVHDGAPHPTCKELPGNYLPFDDTILDRARQSAIGMRMTEEEYTAYLKQKFVFGKLEARDARRAAYAKDLLERREHIRAYAQRQYDQISDVEWEQIRGQRLNPEPYKAKPTVVLSS